MNALPIRTHACKRSWKPCCLGSEGFPHGRTARLLEISENTLREYFREFLDGGIERLKEIRWTGPTRALSPFGHTIKDDFEAHPPATLQEAQPRIEQLTGIRRGRTQVMRFSSSWGFPGGKSPRCRPRRTWPCRRILKNELGPRLKEAQEGKRSVFFVEAAHFVYGSFLGYLWTLTRLFVKIGSGRKRFDVLGALHAVPRQVIVGNRSHPELLQIQRFRERKSPKRANFERSLRTSIRKALVL